MQTFRAYLRDAAGTITWAAWIEAAHLSEAQAEAGRRCVGGTPTVDLWSATERRLSPSAVLDAV